MRYRKCYQHTFPPEVTTVINDGMPLVKYKGPGIDTIQDYIHRHILRPVKAILDDHSKNVNHFYMLLDRGNTIAKRIFAHSRRNRGVVPMPEPTKYPYVLPTDGMLTTEWNSLIANRELTRREVYPLFYRALIEVYTPPPGKCVVIDGAPNRPLTKQEYNATKDTAFSTVYFSRTLAYDPGAPVQMSSRDILATPVASGPVTYRGACPQDLFTHDIQEGDLSAFFHVNKHFPHRTSLPGVASGESILIDSNDGDTVMIALLHARDRIDLDTGRFTCRLWVLLRGQAANRQKYEAKKKAAIDKGEEWVDDVIDGRDIYININMLYFNIEDDPDFATANYPHGTVVLLYILSGTDFFDDYESDDYALFFDMNWEKHVWNTYCTHSTYYRDMLCMFYGGAASFNQPELLRQPYIKETVMLQFIYQCYSAKYGVAIKKLNGVTKITPKMIESYTAKFHLDTVRKEGEDEAKWNARYRKAKKKRVPPEAVLIRYIRLALLNLTYWINDYRPGGTKMVDPLEKYEGLPFYGFIADPTDPSGKRIVLSPICSPAKPEPPMYAGSDADAIDHRAEAEEQAKKEAARQAKRVKEMERTARLKEMHSGAARKRVAVDEPQMGIAEEARKRLAFISGGGGGQPQ